MDKEGAMVERYEGLPATKGGAPAFAFKVSPVKEGTLLAVAVVTVVSGYLLGGRFIKRDRAPCDRMTINRFDRGAVRWHKRVLGPLSYLMEVAAIVTPAILTIRDRGFSRELAGDLWVYTETFAVSSVLNVTIKTLAQRPVPLLYTGLYPDLEKKASSYRSFYSGHTAQMTNALVANAVMSHLRGRRRAWPWALAAIGTAAVSLARVGSGRHFYSDVAAGALAGGMVGSLVPLLHPAKRLGGTQPAGRGVAHGDER
jgi:membrane-associated phospholipid phosphatase